MSGGVVGFDLDMTLIDSRPTVLASYDALALETGVAIDVEVIAGRLGLKLEDELAHWFEPARIEDAAERFRAHYLALEPGRTRLLAGAEASLDAVLVAGDRPVIITAKHPLTAGPCLRLLGLDQHQLFAFVHGPEKAGVLREIAARLYVGDSPPDMAAAAAAGVPAVGVTTGSFDARELATRGPRGPAGSSSRRGS